MRAKRARVRCVRVDSIHVSSHNLICGRIFFPMPHHIFITGANGFLGSHLIPELLKRGHTVIALVRAGSEKKVPSGCKVVTGDALNASTYASKISPADTFIHLIGVAHPSPSRAHEFREIDLKSVEEAVPAAKAAGVKHFIYLSVPQPLPVMKAYGAVRAEGEALVKASGMAATFVRPFYVLGPGRRWPIPLLPFFWLLRIIAPKMGRKLFPVTVQDMVSTLCWAVENVPKQSQIFEGVDI